MTAVPPSVALHQQLIGAPLGSTVSLDCTIESSPTGLHFWSRSDDTVLHEAAKYIMQSSSSAGPSAVGNKLTIILYIYSI